MEIYLFILVFIIAIILIIKIAFKEQPSDVKEVSTDGDTESQAHEHENQYTDKDKLIAGIIVRNRQCWKCHRTTRVIAIRLFSSYKGLKIYMSPKIIPDDVYIPKKLLNTIQTKFPFYKKKYSYTQKSYVTANTCENCGSLQGHFFLYEEPDGVFF